MQKYELFGVKPIRFNKETRWQAKAKFPGYPRGRSIAIFNINDNLCAIPSLCPHEGANFLEGILLDAETIECPAHQNRYNLFTELNAYRVEMEGEKMYLYIDDTPYMPSQVSSKSTEDTTEETKSEESAFSEDLPSTRDAYEKKMRSLKLEIEELRSVKAAQEMQVVDGYNKIESMLQELEEQKGQLEIQNVIIQKTSEFINRVMDTMEEILIVIGTDGKVRQVNKKITILLGFKNEEILGENPDKFFSEANLVELREKYIPAAKEVPSIIYYIISNNAQLDLIANLVNKKQESIVHLIRGSLLYNQHGKKDGMVLVCTNIEELQRVQTQLIKTLEKVDNLRKESEHLLLNILPKDVAQELKTKGNVKPVSYEYVTVLFTDFKGFTNVAEKLNPEELIMELDTCFTSFDKIIENYSIEKLKTIGDAYMCAGGIPLRNRSNPFDVVLAALQVREFMEALKEERIKQNQTYFELRIGIHTGALVAGVVGKNKFAYDIWGDTVNMASRMESSGTPGKVNISIVTYGIIKDFFDCEARGMVYAKRKGDVEMFFVNRIKPEYSLDEKGIFPNQKFLDYIAKLR